jgi:hypothetical protein
VDDVPRRLLEPDLLSDREDQQRDDVGRADRRGDRAGVRADAVPVVELPLPLERDDLDDLGSG